MDASRAGHAPRCCADFGCCMLDRGRLRVRPLAGRWPGTHAATDAAKPQGWRPAAVVRIYPCKFEYVAVMIHVMRGAGEPLGSSAPRSCPGLGQTSRTCLPAIRMPLRNLPSCSARSPIRQGLGSRFEHDRNGNTRLRLGVSARAGNCASVTSKRTVASVPGELLDLACGLGGELAAPGPFARLGERRRKTDAAVSDGILVRPPPPQWQESFGRKPPWRSDVLILALRFGKQQLRSRKRGVRARQRGLNGNGRPWACGGAGDKACAPGRARACCCCRLAAMHRPRSRRPLQPSGSRPRPRPGRAARSPLPGARGRDRRSRLVGRGRTTRGGRDRRRDHRRRARTRFSLISPAAPLPDFHARRPLPGDHRHARREFPPAQGVGPAGPRRDPGVPLWPVRGRQIAHRHRHQRVRCASSRARLPAGRRSGGDAESTSISTPTDARPSCTHPPTAPRPSSPDATEAANKAKADAKPVIVDRCGPWRRRSRRGQRTTCSKRTSCWRWPGICAPRWPPRAATTCR